MPTRSTVVTGRSGVSRRSPGLSRLDFRLYSLTSMGCRPGGESDMRLARPLDPRLGRRCVGPRSGAGFCVDRQAEQPLDAPGRSRKPLRCPNAIEMSANATSRSTSARIRSRSGHRGPAHRRSGREHNLAPQPAAAEPVAASSAAEGWPGHSTIGSPSGGCGSSASSVVGSQICALTVLSRSTPGLLQPAPQCLGARPVRLMRIVQAAIRSASLASMRMPR